MVYLLHFNAPFKHARHYIGYCGENGLDNRLKEHRTGQGARLIAVIEDAGIDFVLARTWPRAGRDEERRLKKYHKGSQHCPLCKQAAKG